MTYQQGQAGRATTGTTGRKEIPRPTQAALWALSNGRCYAPACTAPVVVEVDPGVYRKNAVVAHIYGVKPGAARHRPGLSVAERDSFTNLLLLCLPHSAEVDDTKTGAAKYPPETLRGWKQQHEATHGAALAALGSIDEEKLTELLVGAFTPPLKRLQEIADQLEETGTLNATTVGELRQIVEMLSTDRPDASTARSLTYAAEVFSSLDLKATARHLAGAAEMLNASSRRPGRYGSEYYG